MSEEWGDEIITIPGTIIGFKAAFGRRRKGRHGMAWH